MRCLLHACCGPCSLEPVRIYQEEHASFSIYFDNPNIHPADEYRRRLETIGEHVCAPDRIELVEGPYDPETWEKEAGIWGLQREERCRACYRMRFRRLAAKAVELGFDAIGTTLTISPYQYTDVIIEELERAATEAGIASDARDWSGRYQEATRRSRELGMYRQNYCGCRFSMAEAALERKQRAEQRKRAKRVKELALLAAAAEGTVNQLSQL